MTAMEYGGPERRRGGPDRRGTGETTRILVVDDHALFRVGIATSCHANRTSRSSVRRKTRGARSIVPSRPLRTSS
jgi:hypothetical protein